MRRFASLLLVMGSACSTAPTTDTQAQQPNPQLAARCAELGAIWDRYGARRSEGSGGPDMIRVGAGIDCSKGRYTQGITALEDLLQRNKIPFPPG